MKLILLPILFALNVHADEIVFIKNEYFNDYNAVSHLQAQENDLAAIQKLKHLLAKDTQNESYILNQLSKLYQTSSLTHRFISFLNSQITKAPFNTHLHYQLTKEYLATQKPAEACEKAKFILPHVNNKENFYPLLSDCSLALNRPDEALAYLDKSINQQADPALYLKRAELHLKLNNLSLAKSDLDIYFLKAKPHEQAYLLQAELYTKQQLLEKTPETYKRCLEAVGVSESCFLGYLNVSKDFNTTFKLEHFNKHLATYEQSPFILIEIGRHYQQIKNFEQAEKMYQLAAAKNPEKIEPVNRLFDLYNQQKFSQKAFDVLGQFMANAHNPTDIQTAQNLQNSLYQKKNLETSTYAEKQPGSSQAPSAIPDKYRQMYLTKKYTEILLQYRKVQKKSDAEYFLLGNINYHLGSYSNAKLYWSKIKPASPLYYKAIFNTTVVMSLGGMTTAANKLFTSTEFPLEMYSQAQKLTALLSEAAQRLPANEKKKVTELLTSLLYLEWEP
ncbi:tetratricopeptide repeat protein [Pseudobdellovibrio sp. HCB154]|uniref:tetratricopeptide repeat protein n=1 Tax=Pseudobdellovibrio sp. HCB154 TaxID=3386277 RepID=UPI00391755C9